MTVPNMCAHSKNIHIAHCMATGRKKHTNFGFANDSLYRPYLHNAILLSAARAMGTNNIQYNAHLLARNFGLDSALVFCFASVEPKLNLLVFSDNFEQKQHAHTQFEACLVCNKLVPSSNEA